MKNTARTPEQKAQLLDDLETLPYDKLLSVFRFAHCLKVKRTLAPEAISPALLEIESEIIRECAQENPETSYIEILIANFENELGITKEDIEKLLRTDSNE